MTYGKTLTNLKTLRIYGFTESNMRIIENNEMEFTIREVIEACANVLNVPIKDCKKNKEMPDTSNSTSFHIITLSIDSQFWFKIIFYTLFGLQF